MSNANEPAYPAIKTDLDYDRDAAVYVPNTYSVGGLTKREYFAAMAMQGLLASPQEDFTGFDCPTFQDQYDACAVRAAGYADALLAELERTK